MIPKCSNLVLTLGYNPKNDMVLGFQLRLGLRQQQYGVGSNVRLCKWYKIFAAVIVLVPLLLRCELVVRYYQAMYWCMADWALVQCSLRQYASILSHNHYIAIWFILHENSQCSLRGQN